MLTFGSLFAGIGGFDLGFSRAGMVCKWQVEIDEFCRQVLEMRFPQVLRYEDARTFPPLPELRRTNGERSQQLLVPQVRYALADSRVNVICGGFPCQPVSVSGMRLGEQDERWMWPDFRRAIELLRPEVVAIENTPGLLSVDSGRAFGGILSDLAGLGYDAEWDVLSACMFGASHMRRRLFLVAHSMRGGFKGVFGPEQERQADTACRSSERQDWNGGFRSDFVRVADGLSSRVDRVKTLGNSVCPVVTEWIGRRIIEATKHLI